MRRIRTIQGAFDEIRAADPDSAITLCAIRRAVTEGDIPSRRVGSGRAWKYFIDLEKEYMLLIGGIIDILLG